MFLYIQFCILSVSRLYISAQSVGSGTKSREPRKKKKKKKKAWLLAACVTSRTLYRDRVSWSHVLRVVLGPTLDTPNG